MYKLLNTNEINYQSIAKANVVDMKSCGLSQIKSNTIKNISSIINDNPTFLTELKEKPKSDVINELTKIKGIGIWTAQMFLMSGLKNLDIFAPNDSGLMKGIRIVYFNNVKPKQANVEEITSPLTVLCISVTSSGLSSINNTIKNTSGWLVSIE